MDGNTTTLVENTRLYVGALETIDEDPGSQFTYQLLDHWESFHIEDGNKLYVTSNTSLDFEIQPDIAIMVQSTDNGHPPMSITKEFTFQVLDTNEAPTLIDLNNNQVISSAPPGSIVGFVEVLDPDNVNPDRIQQTHNCTVESGNTPFVFNNSNMALQVDFILYRLPVIDVGSVET